LAVRAFGLICPLCMMRQLINRRSNSSHPCRYSADEVATKVRVTERRTRIPSLRRIASHGPECEEGRKQSEEYKHHPIEGPHPVTPVVRRDGHEQKNSDWDRNPNHPSDCCRD